VPLEKNRSDLIYLNNAASTWPKPDAVLTYVQEAILAPYLEPGRTTLEGEIDYPKEARLELSSFFRTDDPDRYVFTRNATDSLNILIHGFAAGQADPFHVITTDLEHNSVIRPLKALEREGKISLSVIPAGDDGHIHPDALSEKIIPKTRLAVINHGSNVIGTVQDIRTIGSLLQEEGIFSIIDGAQTAGQIPIDLSKTGIDAFVFTGHKYLFGLPGIGGFFLQSPDEVVPLQQGGTGFDSGALFHPMEMPVRFESGTPNFPGIASITAGLRYISGIGLDQVISHTSCMSRYIFGRLSRLEPLILHTPTPDTPVISFNIQGVDPEDVGLFLGRAHAIVTRTGLHCAPWLHNRLTGGGGSVRISISYLNTMEQCRTVCDIIEGIVQHENHEG
jgi:selenocysteine lyase/cysteine desulfurase